MRSPLFFVALAALGLWFAERHRRADQPFMMYVMGIGAFMMLVLALRLFWRGRRARSGDSGSGSSPG
jgi:cytochrome b561